MRLYALRTAVAAAASTVSSTWELDCLPYVPDNIDPPTLYVRPDRVRFDLTHGRGTDEIILDVVLLVSTVEDRAAQEYLDSFVDGGGLSSLKTAIEAPRRTGTNGRYAGDVCDDLHVSEVEAYRWYRVGEVEYLGARWAVRCIGSGGS